MNRWVRVAVLLGGGGAIALGAELSSPGTDWAGLALVGGAIAAGELIELRPPYRAALPVSFAYMVVLAGRTEGNVDNASLVLLVALLATFLVRHDPATPEGRVALLAERLLEGLATVLVFNGLSLALGEPTGPALLIVLAGAAITPILVAEVARMVRVRNMAVSIHGRSADLALVTSAILMGISDKGVDGESMGLWGPLVFTIPLLAAWYSYERLGEIRRTYDQTIRALGSAPELGGIVRTGHAERVAGVAVSVGHELGFSRHELAQLETAALLHHLGQVCLDEPDDGRAPEPAAVASSGADILRSTPLLAPAGDIIASESMPLRDKNGSRPSVLSGQILKVASAFDELSEGLRERAPLALEALYCAPAYLYDVRVLAALETVLDRAGMLEPAA